MEEKLKDSNIPQLVLGMSALFSGGKSQNFMPSFKIVIIY